MRPRDVVQSIYNDFVRAAGFSNKARSWYRRTDETIVVLTLTRTPYGQQYFLAVGIVLRALDADQAPKQKDCQLRSRIDRLASSTVEHQLNDLLDLRFSIDDAGRREQLLGLLRSELLPLVEASATVDGLRSGRGADLVRHSTVSDEARAYLAGFPSAREG